MCVCVCINGITTNTTHSAPFLRAGRLPASSHILYSKIPLHEKINPNPNPKPCLRPVLAGLLLILRNPYRCCELASSLHQCIFCIVTFHCAQFFFFFFVLFITYNSHHKIRAHGGRITPAPQAPACGQKTKCCIEGENPAAAGIRRFFSLDFFLNPKPKPHSRPVLVILPLILRIPHLRCELAYPLCITAYYYSKTPLRKGLNPDKLQTLLMTSISNITTNTTHSALLLRAGLLPARSLPSRRAGCWGCRWRACAPCRRRNGCHTPSQTTHSRQKGAVFTLKELNTRFVFWFKV